MVCMICKYMTSRNLMIGELGNRYIHNNMYICFMCVCLLSVQFPAHICSDHLLLMFALGAFLAKKCNFHNIHFSLIVFWKKIAQTPRNLALSVCRATFPRFSDTSGGWATSTMDPSAARTLDPLRRS